MAGLNEALFAVLGLLDFSAVLRHKGSGFGLELGLRLEPGAEPDGVAAATLAAESLLAARHIRARVVARVVQDDGAPLARLAKRTLKTT